MRTRCVGHACLEIETNGLRIVTDPWWAGPAFSGQWHAWPPPAPAGLESRPVDYVYISHALNDHFHPETLRTLRPGATALVPELLGGQMARRLRRELGFASVIELRHGRSVNLRRGLRATGYVNLTDSVLVLEDGDRVLVDANDALHTAPPATIDHLCRLIRRRHPVIDQLYVGYSGRSWFPNSVRVPGKNDRVAARSRELLYAENFVRVVEQLSPRVACAFGASDVLVEPHNRWVNEARLEVPAPDELYERKHPNSGTRTRLLRPNDVIDGTDIIEGTCPRPCSEELARAFQGALREPSERAQQLMPLPPDHLRTLVRRLDDRLRTGFAPRRSRAPFAAELRLRDNPETAIQVELGQSGARAALGAAKVVGPPALLLRAALLEALLDRDDEMDAIFVGSGAVAMIARPDQLEQLQQILAHLASRPNDWREAFGALCLTPLRTMNAVWSQRWPLAIALGVRLRVLSYPYEIRQLGPDAAGPLRAAA